MVGSSSFEFGVPVLFSFYIITFVLSFGCHYFCFNIFYYCPFLILWKTWHSHTVCVPIKRKLCNGCVRKPVNVHNDGLSPEYPYFGAGATPSLYILLVTNGLGGVQADPALQHDGGDDDPSVYLRYCESRKAYAIL